MRQIILFLILLLPFQVLVAQTTYESGYIVKHDGDTLNGKIQFDWSKNIQVVNLRNGSIVRGFKAKDVTAFKYERGDLYLSGEVRISGNDEPVAFLKVLAKGTITFYQGYDRIAEKLLYFMELEQSVDLKEVYFKEQLSEYIQDCDEAIGELDQLKRLSDQSLQRLGNIYNQCHNQSDIYQRDISLRKSGPQLGIMVGAQFNDFTFLSGGTVLPDDLNTSPEFTPNLGIEAMFQFENRRAFALGLLSYYSQFSTSKTFFESRPINDGFSTLAYDWHQWTTFFNVHLNAGSTDQHLFFNTGVGISQIWGASGVKSLDTGSQVELVDESSHHQFRFSAGAGYRFKKWRAALNYEYGSKSSPIRFKRAVAGSLRITYLLF